MKTAMILLAVVGVALGMPQLGGPPAGGVGATAAAGPGPAAKTNPVNPYGPRVYGMGLNNPWALPPHPFLMQRAQQILKMTPGALLRVNADGSLDFTDKFGQEVDITDNFGNELEIDF